MSMTDPIADMLTRIRNACTAKHSKVDVPASRLKREVARVLAESRFIDNFAFISRRPFVIRRPLCIVHKVNYLIICFGF